MIEEIILSIKQGCDNALDISQAVGVDPKEVQNCLHKLDDEGRVLMRNGIYRLSKSEELRNK